MSGRSPSTTKARSTSTNSQTESNQSLKLFADTEASVDSNRSQTHLPGTADYRFWARSEVFALEASRSSDVTSFRNTQLPAGLLDPNDVAKWIEDRLEREGAPDVWLTVREQDLRGELRRLDVEGFRRSVQEISWTEPESEGVRRRAINSNRTLAQLRSISARLTRRYGWQRAHATTFVPRRSNSPGASTLMDSQRSVAMATRATDNRPGDQPRCGTHGSRCALPASS